ncbi:hypothetical protein ABVT39_002798 [Epinephelus coioides]
MSNRDGRWTTANSHARFTDHEEGYSGWVVVLSVRTLQWLGWVTKNGRTCGEIGANVQLSGQPETAQASGTDLAHGSERTVSGARMWPCVRTVASIHDWEDMRKEQQVLVLTG